MKQSRFAEIYVKYGSEYVLRQLAEECCELAQATLKVIRAKRKETPMRADEAYEHLVEELADVSLMQDVVIHTMLSERQRKDITAIKALKEKRMYERLLDGEMEEDMW